MLQNIIWLIAYGHTSDEIVKHAVFNDSFGSKLKLIYLNFKSIFWGKMREVKRLINKKIA